MSYLNISELLDKLNYILNNQVIKDHQYIDDENKFMKTYYHHLNDPNNIFKITSYLTNQDAFLLKTNENKKPFSLCELIDILERQEKYKQILVNYDNSNKIICGSYVENNKIILIIN